VRVPGDALERRGESSTVQVEAARQFGLATQVVSYDSNTISQYANAAAADNTSLMRFYRETLIRPEFLPILDRWEQQVAAGSSPENLLSDENYVDTQLSSYRATEASAEALSQEAGDEADDYVLTTLILASALFFAGLTTSFRVRFARLLLLGSSLLIAYAAARLVDLSIA
jgi:hypothetical protein